MSEVIDFLRLRSVGKSQLVDRHARSLGVSFDSVATDECVLTCEIWFLQALVGFFFEREQLRAPGVGFFTVGRRRRGRLGTHTLLLRDLQQGM